MLDTGPLVAMISKDDADHQPCVAAFANLNKPPITCWPVITEAAWLLRHNLESVETLIDYASEGIITLADIDPFDFCAWLHPFFSTYADQRPQLADAALMFLAEQHSIDTIMTLDRRDFSVYRTSDGAALALIP